MTEEINIAKNVKYVNDYDGAVYPVCPTCGEIAYNYDSCVFCGQRFSHESGAENEDMTAVETDEYFIGQAGNCHITMIDKKTGATVLHAQYTEKLTESELLDYISLHQMFLERRKTVAG